MPMKTELAFSYDQRMRPVSAKCSLCGEGMPAPASELSAPADIVFWLAQKFVEHKKLKHSAASDLED